jgi:histidine kinase
VEPNNSNSFSWYKRLRWQLLAPQFLVVFVGVGIMVLATLLILSAAPALIRTQLIALATNPALVDETEAGVLATFRNAILLSVLIAAVLALIAGIVSAITLWRIIIDPLHQVAASSQRIADGRYSERVPVPNNSGKAMAQLIISFNQMAAALEQTEQQRVALLSNVSHELRTPLTGLRGYLEGMLDGLFPANEETFAWMSTEIARLHHLVDDIQNLSTIESGQFSLNIINFELSAIIQRIINQLQPQAQSKALKLTFDSSYAQLDVHADPDRTTQILINLIGNAIRYTPDGGEIAISIQTNGRNATIKVQDTGIGIPTNSLPYVFERFYRVDASRARKSGGSGIGLTISRHLAWAMAGELTVTSDGLDKGSTFTLTLPLA